MLKQKLSRQYKILLSCVLLGLASLTTSVKSHAADVGVLVAYDVHTWSYFGGHGQVEAAMHNWVAQINQIYSNTGIQINLYLAGTVWSNPPGSDMGQVLGNIRNDSNINNRRNEVAADFVVQLHATGNCGVGYVAVDANWAYSVVGPQCGAQTMAHEMGHTMGLTHSRRQGDTGGTRYGYALGYGVDNVFATTMAYPQVFNTQWVPYFSSPAFSCNGLQCGIWPGHPEEADASLALNNVRDELAAFRIKGWSLRAQHSNKCVDVAGWGTHNGANIQQWDCHGGHNQIFQILDGGNGYWRLRSLHSGKCLDVAAWGTHSGANILQWDCHGGDNQRFYPTHLGGGVYQLSIAHSGKCIDVQNPNSGSNVYQYSCHSGLNQRFLLELHR